MVIVIGTVLSSRIRRIADNDANIQFFLFIPAGAVIDQNIADQIAFFIKLEGVGQANAVKWLIARLPTRCRDRPLQY